MTTTTGNQNAKKNRSSVSEVGHAKNVANFQDLIEFITGYNTAYNPSKTSLQLPSLIALKQDAEATLTSVITNNTVYNGKVNERLIAFSPIRSFATRIINALQATNASSETIKDAKTVNRKIQGKRAAAPQPEKDPNTPAPASISTSQQSYDQLLQHLASLNAILDNEPSYSPNETELQIANIQLKIAELNQKNNAVATAYTAVSNARIERNEVLYKKPDSLVNTAIDVKNYVKSLFGATSPQYAQIKSIKFARLK